MPFIGSGAPLTALNASNLASGTVPTARLGTGTASSSTFLRGDGTWAAAGGGSTNFGDVGTYAVLINTTKTSVAINGTVAGSSLRHSWNAGDFGWPGKSGGGTNDHGAQIFEFGRIWSFYANSTYAGGGTALSGTWRKMSNAPTYTTFSAHAPQTGGYPTTFEAWIPALYVRIS